MSVCKKDKNQLRELYALGKGQTNSAGMLTPTYLRWCDKCNTIYILKPEELTVEKMQIPLLEYKKLPQMEVL